VDLPQRPAGEIEPDLRRTCRERLDVLPGNELFALQVLGTWVHGLEEPVDHGLPAQAAHEAAKADVDVGHAQLAAGAQQVQVVHALDLGVVGVDDLPVEHVLRERDLAPEKFERLQRLAAFDDRALGLAGDDLAPIGSQQLAADADAQCGHLRVGGFGSVGEHVYQGADADAALGLHRPVQERREKNEGPFARWRRRRQGSPALDLFGQRGSPCSFWRELRGYQIDPRTVKTRYGDVNATLAHAGERRPAGQLRRQVRSRRYLLAVRRSREPD